VWPFKKPAPAVVPDDGNIYGAYIKSLLDHEQDRKSVLEAKASAVITTSGALVTLLFGLVAVVTGATNFKLPETSRGWLIAAVLLFVIAAGLGIMTANTPVPYGQATFQADQLQQAWSQPASAARENVAKAQLELIPVAAQKNNLKVKLVISATLAELLALVALAVAVILILT
jgi:disulfide bond formation protein DsbB